MRRTGRNADSDDSDGDSGDVDPAAMGGWEACAAAIDAGVPARARGYNGRTLAVDLATAADHVTPAAKLCMGLDGKIKLLESLVWVIDQAMGEPKAAKPVSGKSVDAIDAEVSRFLGVYEVHAICAACGYIPEIRASDCVTAATVSSLPNYDNTHAAATVIVKFVMEDQSVAGKFRVESDLLISALIANAMHREITGGHNWFTRTATNSDTESNRCLGVAGGLKERLKPWMAKNGHDTWHHLSHAGMTKVARILCKDNTVEGYERFVAPRGFVVGGKPVGGTHLSDLLLVQDATKERYPLSMSGKAAIMTGLDAAASMVHAVSSKLQISNAAQLAPAITTLANAVSAYEGERSVITRLRATLAPVISFARGFAVASTDVGIEPARVPALDALAKTKAADRDAGANLYKILKQVTPDKQAVGASVQSALTE